MDLSDPEFYDDATVSPVAIVGDACGKKGRPTFHHCGCDWCGHPNRLVPPPPRPHLYVVVDDWREGFSLHKIDLDDDDELWAGSQADQYQRLPSPAAFRMEFSNVCAGAQFTTLGRRIVGCTQGRDGLTVVYDTGTAAHAIVRPSPYPLLFREWYVAVAAGDCVYAFVPITSDYLRKPYSDKIKDGMYCMEEHIESPEFPFQNEDFYHDRKQWSWSTDPAPLPFDLDNASRIVAYAVHPGGKAIFV
ncbi:hypothetical protein BAE44_0010091 [Dichanthelium oligosanthes]|uniref:Uncharacterized protein n=1 Tax=Dichanthelium oligosanthes TaxID=888268 RepID=A0A1E5VUT2_9POAL|nr:hypothetical protein BAE44_0010091 [Dichanthelium oligosanthes]